ncbi:uncharacterized protein LOC141686487 [Apium graveolens]|uniref:uncharacterized protein LOC141686487 n=1 Tax=Apium graveolens TaxID=4045 RepID=UPI003D7B5665
MKRILKRYEEIIRQVVNFNKFTVVFSPNTREDDREKVCAQLGVREINTPGNYLGIPMIIGRRKASTFRFLLEKVEQKLQAWGSRVILKAKKVMLLKTAAQTIPNFWMSLFLIPREIIDMIDKKMNAFWWGSNGGTGGIRWMAWERLCEVKEEGVLGSKKLHEFNIAMLAKQAWRIINNVNPLVTQLLKARYHPTIDFLNALPVANQSYVWRSILETQEVVRQGCRRRIGDGKDTRVSQVPWLPDKYNGYLTSAAYPELEHMTVNGLISMDGREWDSDIITELCNERDVSLIYQVPIPMRIRSDSWFWIHEEKGVFFCKIENFLRRVARAQETKKKHHTNSTVQQKTWSKPPEGWIKINIDVACYTGRDNIGVGCVVRDDRGVFQRARSNQIGGLRKPREAEALSMREALSWVKGRRASKYIFETDSKLLVDAFHAIEGRSMFDTIVEDCRELAKHYEDVLVKFVPRSTNSVAHEVARAAYSNSGLREWYNTAPDFIICNLLWMSINRSKYALLQKKSTITDPTYS